MSGFSKKITGKKIAVVFTVVGFLATSILFVRNIQAQNQTLSRLNAFAWYIPSNVSGLHIQEFLGLKRIRGVTSNVQNINDFRSSNKKEWGQALVNQMTASAQKNPNAIQVMGFMSHGDPGSYYTATGFPMPTEVAMVTAAYQNANVQGISIVDCCGSGNVASYVKKNGYDIYGDGLNNLGSITSSAPGVSSTVGNDSSVSGRLARLRGSMGDVDGILGPKDSNGKYIDADGIATMAELKEAFAKKGWENQFIIPPGNEGAPVLALNDEAMKDYMKKWRGTCAVVKPGQDEAFGKAVWGMDNVFKNDDKSREPVDIKGKLATLKESDLNFELRKNNFGCLSWSMENGKSTDTHQQPGCNPADQSTSNYDILEKEATKGGGKAPDWASGGKYKSLSEEQARQALADALHAYKVPEDKTMRPTFYTKGARTNDAKEQVVFVRREDCKFVTPPSPLPFSSPKPNANNPFGNNSGGNQGGNGNEGGGQQNGGNQASPSPSPSGNTANNSNDGVICPQTYDPVCDINGQTQPNECVATQQKKVTIKHVGACTDADKKQTSMSVTDLSNLIKQVVTSGIPEDTITSIIQSIVRLFSSYMSGNTTTTGVTVQ